MSKSNLKNKFLSLLLVMALVITMIPMNAFASESTDELDASCDEGVHDFTVEKYDESNHWYECSICGVADELLCHYYDENGDTICNGCSYERSVIEEISIDKILMSEGETATITLKVIEGYTAKWIYFYKPITNNTESVYLYLDSDNTYEGSFSVDDQTESGIWKVKYITLKNAEDEYVYLYNSNNYTGASYDKEDLSSLNFEVTGTNADIVAPVIESYSVDKAIVSAGEKVTVSVQVTDDHLPSSFYFWYKNPSSESEYVSMEKVDDTGLYQGAFSIDANSESGLWRPYYFTVSDTNGNSTSLYNSKVTSYGSNKVDLSLLNFEVVEMSEDENEDAESFIVKFTDGYGNTLSTQRVNKGEDAVEPETPTNELYLFNGWDTDFTNITCNTRVTATWILNPDVVYDKETHIGKTFTVEVYSTASQTYTITCSDAVDFTSSLVSSGMIFTDQLYYSKKYAIEVNDPGSYLFCVKGSRSSNTLTYKVRVNEHEWESDYTVDKEATCAETGLKSIHCFGCDAKKESTIIPTTDEHSWGNWIIDESPTCTTTGIKHRTCKVCGEIENAEVAANGHTWESTFTVDKEPTCSEKGSKSIHCKVCSAKIDITEIQKDSTVHRSTSGYSVPAAMDFEGVIHEECSLCGMVLKHEVISPIKSVTLSNTIYTYDGNVKRPSVEVRDANGKVIESKYYTVTYSSGRKKVGTYTVTVIFDDSKYNDENPKYWDTVTRKFSIVKDLAAPSKVGVKLYGYDDVQVNWSKVSGASGYYVYYKKSIASSWSGPKYTTSTSYKFANLADGTKYSFRVYPCIKDGSGKIHRDSSYKTSSSIYTLKKISTPTVKKYSSGKVKVSWNNISGETGYQISKSTKKSGTSIVATYKTTSGKSKTISATKGKTYYYKVRAYKVVDGKKIYGPWSSVKKYKR